MQKKGANISLKGYDDIFSTDQSRAEAQQERVCIRHTPAATKALANGHFARASGHPRFGLIQQSL